MARGPVAAAVARRRLNVISSWKPARWRRAVDFQIAGTLVFAALAVHALFA